jgi:hypothetical protein
MDSQFLQVDMLARPARYNLSPILHIDYSYKMSYTVFIVLSIFAFNLQLIKVYVMHWMTIIEGDDRLKHWTIARYPEVVPQIMQRRRYNDHMPR